MKKKRQVTPRQKRRVRWEPYEDEIIRRLYPQAGVAGCRVMLGHRSEGAIRGRACSLMVRQRSVQPLADALDVRALVEHDIRHQQLSRYATSGDWGISRHKQRRMMVRVGA